MPTADELHCAVILLSQIGWRDVDRSDVDLTLRIVGGCRRIVIDIIVIIC